MSENGFYIEVDKADIARVQRKLKDLGKASGKLRNAINRTATEAMKGIRAGRKKGYTINATRFNKDIQVKRANTAHLDATIKASGTPPTLKANFKTSTTKTKGVKVDIVKTGLKEVLSRNGGGHPFVGTGGDISGLVAQRTGKSSYPLKVLHANSVPKMTERIWTGENGGQGDMQEKIRAKLMEEMRKEIAKLM